jgi:nucleoside phosphorylase/DNA-binding NarL/FixJ family response regulator
MNSTAKSKSIVPRVLVVEDTPYFQDDIARILGERKIAVAFASNETLALRILQQEAFAVVITDVDLSAGGGSTRGGFLLIERMQSQGFRIPVILTSSFLGPDGINDAYRSGFFKAIRRTGADYLDRLAQAVQEALHESSSSKERDHLTATDSVGKAVSATTSAFGSPEDLPTIGIITALPQEFTAVKATLLDVRERSLSGEGAGRRYSVGRIQSVHGIDHSIALALADMGNNVAAARATLLLEHFHSVNSIIMVGIAGGVPAPAKAEDHVRLGDIVISSKKGVVQYDMVKFSEIRACPLPPNPKLIEAVRLCEANELEGKRPWDDAIKQILTKLNWRRPPITSDILFDTADPEKPLKHPTDHKRRGTLPRVFLGPIASANELLKDPVKRDSLRDRFGVKGVEMEGSGIADATWTCNKGYLVVRGVCDYCDAHKNDDWQHYAAAVAAGYTQTLIQSMF